MTAQHFAAYDNSGKIIGLYNTDSHTAAQIPKQSIMIPFNKHLEIVVRPNDFTVVDKRLHDSGASASLPEASSGFKMPPIKVSKWQKGFVHKDICYFADAESSAHITQCLIIARINPKYVGRLKTIDSKGVIAWVDANFEALQAIAEGVNQLRSE